MKRFLDSAINEHTGLTAFICSILAVLILYSACDRGTTFTESKSEKTLPDNTFTESKSEKTLPDNEMNYGKTKWGMNPIEVSEAQDFRSPAMHNTYNKYSQSIY